MCIYGLGFRVGLRVQGLKFRRLMSREEVNHDVQRPEFDAQSQLRLGATVAIGTLHRPSGLRWGFQV